MKPSRTISAGATLLALALCSCAPAHGTTPSPVASAASPAAASSSAPATPSPTPTPTPSPTPTPTPPATPTPTPAPQAPAAVDCRVVACVALTYDDGPSTLTPQLLDAFTSRGATATLFMIGSAAHAHSEIVRDAHRRGFEVANHTWSHPNLSQVSDAVATQEMARTNATLQDLTGVPVTLMRPPYAGRTRATDVVAGQQGLAVVTWSNSPEDWLATNRSASRITELTLARTTRNSIILMHDIHPWTVDAAGPIIDALQARGYTLVTVSQLLGPTTPGKLYPLQ